MFSFLKTPANKCSVARFNMETMLKRPKGSSALFGSYLKGIRRARRAAVCYMQLLMKRSYFLHAREIASFKTPSALPVFTLNREGSFRYPVSAAAATVASTSDMQSANTKSRVYSDTIR
jgi:hypothetical protein